MRNKRNSISDLPAPFYLHCYLREKSCHWTVFHGRLRDLEYFRKFKFENDPLGNPYLHRPYYQTCLQCQHDEYQEVAFCIDRLCPHWKIRFGITPKEARKVFGKRIAILLDRTNFDENELYGPEKSIGEMEEQYFNNRKKR